jgi:NADH:ubiquinone oxidoreductase subunit 3 (subunit A)
MDQPAETFKGKSYLEKVILFVVFTVSCILLYTLHFRMIPIGLFVQGVHHKKRFSDH